MADNVKTLLQIEKLQVNIKAEQKKYNDAVKAGNISDEERLAKLKEINAEQAKLKTLKRQVNKEDKANISLNKIQNDYAKLLSAEVNSLNKGKGVTVKKAAQVKNIADQVLTAAEREEEQKGTTAKVYGEIADFGKELNDLQVQNIKNEGQLGKEGFQKVNIAEKEQKLLKLKAMSQSKSLVGHGQSRNAMARMIKDMEMSLKHEKRHAKVLEKKNKLLLGAKNAIKGFVTKLIPAVTIGGLLIGVWKGLKTIVTGFSGLVDKLGTQFGVVGVQADDAVSPLQTNLLAARTEAIGFGKGMDDVIGITTGLSDEFGISIDEASKLSDEILDSSTAMGLSVDEGAKLFGTLMKIGKMTQAQAEDLAESTYNLAVANKVNPAAVMKDIAQNTEVFAKFGGKGSKNIMQAAVQAKKLGISLSDVASIAENLLDFESSIEAELEASMMLGRRINMGEARRLAMTGDLEGMMNEVVKQAGGLSQWNELDIFQRKSLAKLAGTDLATMGKLVAEKARLASLKPGELDKELKAKETMSTMTELMSKFKQMGASLIVNIGAPLEALFKSFSGWLTTVDEKGTSPFQRIGQFVTDIGKNMGGWVKSIEVFFTKNKEGESGFTEMLEKAKGIAKEIIFWAKLAAGFVIISKTIQFIWAATSAVQKVMNSSQKKMNILSAIWNAITSLNPIGMIVIGITAVIAGIVMMIKHWDKVFPAIKKVGSFLWGLGGMIFKGIAAAAVGIWNALKQPFMDIWNWVTGLFGGKSPSKLGLSIVDGIKSIGTMLLNFMTKPFKGAWKLIKGIVSGDIGIVDAIKGIGNTVLDWITWPFRTAMNFIGSLFGIESLGDSIIQPIKNVFLSAVDWISKIWGSVLDILKAPFNFIIKGINWMIRGINSISIDIPEMLGGGTFGLNIPEIPSLQTQPGEGFDITKEGIAAVHTGESVGTFDLTPVVAAIADLKAEVVLNKKEIGTLKSDMVGYFGPLGTVAAKMGQEFASRLSRFGD